MIYSKSLTSDNHIIIGYTTRLHLLIDRDGPDIATARYIVFRVMEEWPIVGDCLIAKTGRGYHLIFDNGIGYNSCVKIIRTLAQEGLLEKDYEKIRQFRGDMTLRVSERWLISGYSPPPKPLKTICNRNCQRHDMFIEQYLNVLQIGITLSHNGQLVSG